MPKTDCASLACMRERLRSANRRLSGGSSGVVGASRAFVASGEAPRPDEHGLPRHQVLVRPALELDEGLDDELDEVVHDVRRPGELKAALGASL